MVNRLATAPNRTDAASAVSPTAPTDGELLMRYVRHDDDEAFAAVVERHGPMIWGVCSRVLVRRADAEDAYQATLLILARKAGTIRPNDSAAGWLFRVARNAALGALRRRKVLREEALPDDTLPAEEAFPDLEQKQLVVTLMDELQTLPSKYKTPLVLRYLEGRSRREIAAAMDATVATVAGRLVRGRRMLRSRLARRGVSLSAVLGALGAGSAVHAGTIRALAPPIDPTLLASGASSAATALANQGVRSMFYGSLAKPAACGAVGTAVALVLLSAPLGGAGDTQAAEPSLEDATVVVEAEIIDNQSSVVYGNVEGRPVDNSPGDNRITGEVKEASDEEISDAFEAQRKRYAKLAEADASRDLSQPSFEELYWHANHWREKQDALIAELKAADSRSRTVSKQVVEGLRNASDYESIRQEVDRLRVDLPLAKAKIAEYERLMKQAALRESRPGESPPAASTQDRYGGPTHDRNFPLTVRALRTRALAEGAPLGGGDTLLFKFSSDDSPTESFRRCTVDDTGELDLGSGFGELTVAGKTIAEVNELIKERFTAEMPGLVAKLGASNREGPGAATSGWAVLSQAARPTEVPAAILSPGDTVLVDSTFDMNVARINERCIVEADGTIGLGAAIGRVKVSGLTMRQAEKAVQEHVDKDWDDVTIQLTPVEIPIPTPVYRPPTPQDGSALLLDDSGTPRPLPNQGFGVPSNQIR